MANGDADLARMGAASYVLTKAKNPNIRLLVAEEVAGTPHHGVLAVRNDSDITSLGELKGHTLAFGNKHSTLSRYVPQAELMKHGISPDDLADYGYLGRHDKVALAVSLGNYDAGVLRKTVFNQFKAKKGLRAIHGFTAPYHAWIVADDMDGELFAVMQKAFLSIREQKLLAAVKRSGFRVVSDDLYDPLREAMRLSRFFKDAR